MIYITPGKMLATSGVVQLITKKSILTIEEKMKKRSANRKNPNPAAERRKANWMAGFLLLRNYCTTMLADLM